MNSKIFNIPYLKETRVHLRKNLTEVLKRIKANFIQNE